MGRKRYLLSAAAVGAVVALLVYGFGVRGLGLDHGLKSVYMVVAAALLVLSRRLVHGLESEDRPRLRWLAVAVVAGAAIAVVASLAIDPPPSLHRFERHKLPGFTIELPTGKPQGLAQEYSTGMYGVMLEEDAHALVGWMEGDGSRAELEQMAERVKSGFATLVSGSKIVTIADRDSIVLDFKDGRRLLYTTMPCDGRVIFLQTIGLREALHARIVRSFACTPEPHAAEEVPIVLDTTGFTRLENKGGRVYYTAENKRFLGAVALPTVADASTFRAMMPGMLSSEGLSDPQVTPQAPDLLGFTGTARGASVTGTVRNVRCGARSVLVLGFATEPAAAPALAQAVSGARCK